MQRLFLILLVLLGHLTTPHGGIASSTPEGPKPIEPFHQAGIGLKGLDIALSASDARQDFGNAIDQFRQGNHGIAAWDALGGIANMANAVGRFGEIRKLMNCDLQGARLLGLPCFVAGTLVSTPEGPRAIESILSGDAVWGFDQRAGQWRSCMVSYHSQIAYDDLVVTVRANGEAVRSTYHHPYWVISGEDLDERPVPDMLGDQLVAIDGVPGRWVDAGFLRVGDVLVSRLGGGVAPVGSLWTLPGRR